MQREVAAELCRALILSNASLDTPKLVEHLFMFIQPLVIVEDDGFDDNDDEVSADWPLAPICTETCGCPQDQVDKAVKMECQQHHF